MRNKAAQGFKNVALHVIYPDWSAKLKIAGDTLQREGG
jgi:hypothetical protein